MTTSNKPRIALLGAEHSFAIEVVEAAMRLGFEIAAAIVTGKLNWDMKPLHPILHPDEVSKLLASRPAIIGANGPSSKYRVVEKARALGFTKFETLCDPSAIIAGTATVKTGAFIGAGAVVGGSAEVKDFAIVNRNAALGHHCIMGEYSTIGPGAIIASSCYVCKGANLGAGAVLKPDIIVGEGAIVGAGAVVIRDVEPGTIVAGNPAREINKTSAWADRQTQGSGPTN